MEFNIGDAVKITDGIFVQAGYINGIIIPNNGRTVLSASEVAVRIPNYKYLSLDDHHIFDKRFITIVTPTIGQYNCPKCKQNKCSTIECG